MNLAEEIRVAHRRNVAALESKMGLQPPDLQDVERQLLNSFQTFCRDNGVESCPAAPVVIASFISGQADTGANIERILALLDAIERAHDSRGLANPVCTYFVCNALNKLFGPEASVTIEGPRTWTKTERQIFLALPGQAKEIIARRARSDSKLIRSLQNDNATLRKQLSDKGIENNAKESQTTE
jgi:hypothetical protein